MSSPSSCTSRTFCHSSDLHYEVHVGFICQWLLIRSEISSHTSRMHKRAMWTPGDCMHAQYVHAVTWPRAELAFRGKTRNKHQIYVVIGLDALKIAHCQIDNVNLIQQVFTRSRLDYRNSSIAVEATLPHVTACVNSAPVCLWRVAKCE